MCARVRVWEKENEKERARDKERKIKAERTHCVEEESRKIKTRWEEWGWGNVCGGEKTREKKKKGKKCMDARKEGNNNNNKKNKKSQLNVTTIFSQ